MADPDDPVYPDLTDGGDPVVDVRPDGAVDVVFAAPGPAGSALLEFPDGSAWEVDWAQPWIPVSIRLPRELVQLPDAATTMSRHPLVGGLVGGDGALFLADRIARAFARAPGPAPGGSLATFGTPGDPGLRLAGSEQVGSGDDPVEVVSRRRPARTSRGVPHPVDPSTLGGAVVAGDAAFDPVNPPLVRVAAVVTALDAARSRAVLEPLVPALLELLAAVAGRVTDAEIAVVDVDTRLELAKAISAADSSSSVRSRAVGSLRRRLADLSIADRSSTDLSVRDDDDLLGGRSATWTPSPARRHVAADADLDFDTAVDDLGPADDADPADAQDRFVSAHLDHSVERIAANRMVSPSVAGAPGATAHVVQVDDLLWTVRLEGLSVSADTGHADTDRADTDHPDTDHADTDGRAGTGRRSDAVSRDAGSQWLRILRADDLLTLALVPIERDAPTGASAEFVLPPGYHVDDLRFALDAPAPAQSDGRADRIRAAFGLGRTAARITRTDGPSAEADEAWEACARAWSDAGDAARSRLARRMTGRPTTLNLQVWNSRATIADRVARAILDPVHN